MLQGFCVTNVIMMTPENHYHNHKRYLVITVFPLRYHSPTDCHIEQEKVIVSTENSVFRYNRSSLRCHQMNGPSVEFVNIFSWCREITSKFEVQWIQLDDSLMTCHCQSTIQHFSFSSFVELIVVFVSDISCQKLPSKQKRRETPFPCWATSAFVWIWWREETSDIGFCHTHCSMFCVMTINLRSQTDQVNFKIRGIKLL